MSSSSRESHSVQYDVTRAIARQIAQGQPTTVSSIYTPGDGVQTVVKRVIICNTSAFTALANLYHDDDGTTYGAATQLLKDNTIAPGKTLVFNDEIYIDSSGNLGASSDVTAALTFSAYGEESQVRAR